MIKASVLLESRTHLQTPQKNISDNRRKTQTQKKRLEDKAFSCHIAWCAKKIVLISKILLLIFLNSILCQLNCGTFKCCI